MHYVFCKIYYGGLKHTSLYLGLVLPSGGWQSLIDQAIIHVVHIVGIGFCKGGQNTLHWSGLYYKHMTIVNDNSSIVIKWSFKRIDATRGIICDCHMFIIQATAFVSVDTVSKVKYVALY